MASTHFSEFNLPPEAQLPSVVRSYFSSGRIAGQYIASYLALSLGLALAATLGYFLPFPLNLLGSAAAALGCLAFVFVVTRHDHRWIELDGQTLRAKHLYTGLVLERSVAEVESLRAIVHQGQGALDTFLIHKLLGRLKGMEICFRDGATPLRVMLSDPAMTNARELIAALLYRMSEQGELEAEIIEFHGQPLARTVHYQGEGAEKSKGNAVTVYLVCALGMALLFGTLLGFWWQQEKIRQEIIAVPPHELTVAELIKDGPGINRHVTITDFQTGGLAFEGQRGNWTQVWVAMHPTGPVPREIQAVLSSTTIRNQAMLVQQLQAGRVTGIVSAEPRTSWGATLGPNLVQANDGLPLTAAWEIEDAGVSLTAMQVHWLQYGEIACFVGVMVLSVTIFVRG
jgi:hypothetical protein